MFGRKVKRSPDPFCGVRPFNAKLVSVSLFVTVKAVCSRRFSWRIVCLVDELYNGSALELSGRRSSKGHLNKVPLVASCNSSDQTIPISTILSDLPTEVWPSKRSRETTSSIRRWPLSFSQSRLQSFVIRFFGRPPDCRFHSDVKDCALWPPVLTLAPCSNRSD